MYIISAAYLIKRDLRESERVAISTLRFRPGDGWSLFSKARREEKERKKEKCCRRVHLEAAAQFSTSEYVSRV